MIDQSSVPSLMGSTVRDSSGDKIGKVGQVYLDDATGQPEWVTVRTGLFGTHESFVPLAAARVEGDELVVDVPKDRVSDAPRIDEDGHLSEEQEAELYGYYGVSPAGFGRDAGPTEGEHAGPAGYAAGTGGTDPDEYSGRSVTPERAYAPGTGTDEYAVTPESAYAPGTSYPGTGPTGTGEPRTDHAGTLDTDVVEAARRDSPGVSGTGVPGDTATTEGAYETSRHDDAMSRAEEEAGESRTGYGRVRLRRYAPPEPGTTAEDDRL
ncbi:MAG TPA: PRC-barrel domain-containing protein [Mycobacteriales bacterium]|nr:PRC-barrel domain-containing protein [Mycobacteriales bacterium]